MNREKARGIAEKITNEQLGQMFENAKSKIKDWTKTSSVNKGATKGLAWNILARNFKVDEKHHILAKTNMIREFGEFLPEEIKPLKTINNKSKKEPIHQDPKF